MRLTQFFEQKILRKRRDLRLIVSSATVDAEYIRDFFGGKAGVLRYNSYIT